MDSDSVALLSAAGAAVSAIAAVAAFCIAWNAKSIQGASVDFTACLDVTERLRTVFGKPLMVPIMSLNFANC